LREETAERGLNAVVSAEPNSTITIVQICRTHWCLRSKR